MYKRLLIVILFSILAAACTPRIYSEAGKRFDVNYFDQIEPGKTTKQDITSALGEPQQTGIKESGKEMWTYTFLALDYPSRCVLTKASPEIEHDFMRMTITFDGDKAFEKSYEMTKGDGNGEESGE